MARFDSIKLDYTHTTEQIERLYKGIPIEISISEYESGSATISENTLHSYRREFPAHIINMELYDMIQEESLKKLGRNLVATHYKIKYKDINSESYAIFVTEHELDIIKNLIKELPEISFARPA